MKYKLLGRSGLRVSEISLGTMTFGTEWGWGSSKEEAEKIYRTYVEKGGNFIDTANYYTGGTSETYLGEFIAKERDKIVLATKYTLNTNPKDPNAGGNHRKNLVQAVHHSLERLKTDYIDLLWVHAWDNTLPVEEVMRALDDLVAQGKILHIGVSDTPAWIISRGNTFAELRGWSSFVSAQLEYSLLERSIEEEFFPLVKSFDMAICAWSPLAMGVLTGKYLQKDAKGGRAEQASEMMDKYHNEHTTKIVETVLKIAKEANRSAAQIALRWMMQKPGVVIPIVGAKNLKQLEDNLDAVNFVLTDEQFQELDQVSRIETRFPHNFLDSDRVKQIIFGESSDKIINHHV